MPPSTTDQLTGVLQGVKWRSSEPGSDFCIAVLESGETVKGDAPPDELICGITYRFFGQWDQPHPKYGKSFKFKAFSKSEPHSRFGMVKYLARYAPNVGPRIAGRLFDLYESDACKILRTDHARVAREIPGLTLERAREAAAALQEISELEDVKIDLANLFSGRGFPGTLIDQVIRRYGPLAPIRIKRDPFTLLVGEFSGAGFARCDRLYMDLGLPPGRLKRQMICIWHALRADNDGHTWFSVATVQQKLQEHISGVRVSIQRAVKLGIRSGWLEVRKDSQEVWWIAEGQKAQNERTIAERLKLLQEGPVVLPRFTEAVDGECDETDNHVKTSVEIDENGSEHLFVNGVEHTEELDTAALARIGREIGICQFCGRRLVNPVSLRHGYGPVCAERYGLPYAIDDESQDNKSSASSAGNTSGLGRLSGRKARIATDLESREALAETSQPCRLPLPAGRAFV